MVLGISNATLEPSGRLSISHILYQSDLLAVTPLSSLIWIGPKVLPSALILGALEVSLILIKVEIPTTVPVVDVSLILIRNLSVPSVILSLETVLSIDPILL